MSTHSILSRWTLAAGLALFPSLWGAAALADEKSPIKTEKNAGFTMTDPQGDDDGPGTFTYPTDAVYKPGSFDIIEFQVVPQGSTVEFRVKTNSKIEDPWDSAAWGGNGFSVQMAMIHIDMDHKAGSGVLDGLPGTNVRFTSDEAWDKAIIISPQGPTRVNSEIELKCPQWKSRIIVPRITRATGKTLIAVVDVSALGGVPTEAWGYQVIMQSNEGFPDKKDLLTRKVNEYNGQHRFGGGTDYDNDPQVMDILVPPPGDAAKKQHEILSKYNKAVTTEVKPEDLAVVPMVYVFGKPAAPAAAAPAAPAAPAPAPAAPAAAAPAPAPAAPAPAPAAPKAK